MSILFLPVNYTFAEYNNRFFSGHWEMGTHQSCTDDPATPTAQPVHWPQIPLPTSHTRGKYPFQQPCITTTAIQCYLIITTICTVIFANKEWAIVMDYSNRMETWPQECRRRRPVVPEALQWDRVAIIQMYIEATVMFKKTRIHLK